MIYLDHASTTKPTQAVRGAMSATEELTWGNPHSSHDHGIEAAMVIKEAEFTIQKELCVKNEGKIIFTPGGSAANHLVLTSICKGPGDLVTSMGEHRSIDQLRRKYGVGVDLDPRTGTVDPDQVARYVSQFTKLVSIINVSNETGCVNDLYKISKAVKTKNPDVLVHSDIVQAFGKLVIDPNALGLDIVTLSAHKIYGPKGIGCIWAADKAAKLFDLYTGTPSTALIAGFHQAVLDFDWEEHEKHVDRCETAFLTELNTLKVPYLPIIKEPAYDKMAGILALQFPGISATRLTLELASQGVMCSHGPACSHGQSSRVIEHLRGPEVARNTVRFSFGNQVTWEECLDAAHIICEVVQEIDYEDGSKSGEDSGRQLAGDSEGEAGYCVTPR